MLVALWSDDTFSQFPVCFPYIFHTDGSPTGFVMAQARVQEFSLFFFFFFNQSCSNWCDQQRKNFKYEIPYMFGLGDVGVQDESRTLVSLSIKKIPKLWCLVSKNTDFSKGKNTVCIKNFGFFTISIEKLLKNQATLFLNTKNGCRKLFY